MTFISSMRSSIWVNCRLPLQKCSSCCGHNRYRSLSALRRSIFSSSEDREKLTAHQREMMAKGLPKRKPIDGVQNVILVASGKGGVGKSTVAVNLAVGLKREYPTRNIGLLDADIYGPSLPVMMNLRGMEPEMDSKNLMLPLINHGIKCMSMGFLVKEGAPIVWRGLMIMQAIERLLRGVDWNPLDVLVIDMPPGTGDTQLSIAQSVVVNGALIVTTPQQVAVQDALKGALMFTKTNVNLLGFVINMASYQCPSCQAISKVPSKALDKLSSYGDVIGELPFDMDISTCCDEGNPIVLQNSTYATAFGKIARNVMTKLEEEKSKSAGVT